MSPTSDSQSDLLANEELVAYLDGELAPEESRRVEERLANDAEYRQQLRDLDQAWEALDALPATQVDDDFARTTIEMVTVAAQRDAAQRTAQVASSNRSRTAWWIAAAAAMAALGFAVTRIFLPNPNETLIANLPVIQQFDVLSQIDDVEFLRKLGTAVAFEKLAPDPVSIDRERANWTTLSESSAEARRQWVHELPPNEKANLAERAERFHELEKKPETQPELARLQQLERTIRTADDAEQLQRTLLAYGSWLAERPTGEQEDLRVLPADERIRLIQRYVRDDEEDALRHLSDEEATKVRNEMLAIYEDRKSEFERANRRRDDDNQLWLDSPPLRRAWMVVLWALRDDDRDDETKTAQRLISQLSSEQQEYWKHLPRRGRRNQREQLGLWIRDAMRPRWDPQELEEFFTSKKLDSNQKERLLALPNDQMQAQLERLYIADVLGLRGAEEWLGEFGPGAGFPPGPPPGRDGRGRPREGRSRDRDDSDRERSGERDERRPPRNEGPEREPPPGNPPPPRPDGPPQAEAN
jgi:hypothetical protein